MIKLNTEHYGEMKIGERNSKFKCWACGEIYGKRVIICSKKFCFKCLIKNVEFQNNEEILIKKLKGDYAVDLVTLEL